MFDEYRMAYWLIKRLKDLDMSIEDLDDMLRTLEPETLFRCMPYKKAKVINEFREKFANTSWEHCDSKEYERCYLDKTAIMVKEIIEEKNRHNNCVIKELHKDMPKRNEVERMERTKEEGLIRSYSELQDFLNHDLLLYHRATNVIVRNTLRTDDWDEYSKRWGFTSKPFIWLPITKRGLVMQLASSYDDLLKLRNIGESIAKDIVARAQAKLKNWGNEV